MIGNFIGHIHARNFEAEHLKEPLSGLGICGFTVGDMCYNLKIQDNIVAGAEFYGFASPGHNCDNSSDDTFKNNVAHSIRGYGAAIFPNPTQADTHAKCY